MKKILCSLAALLLCASLTHAQDDADKKFRFGLRITPQPTWFVSGDKNSIPSGAILGFGFGLNAEFRLSEVAAFLTGVGGDFEGGRFSFKQDSSYTVSYWLDEANEFVSPTADRKTASTVYILKERKVNTTFATIPLLLKLSTKEYGGLKYFGLFGGELGIRVSSKATDTYSETRKYLTETSYLPVAGETTEADIDISRQSSLIPIRLGLNAGAGTEYRLGGSTAVFASINFFRSFTNHMRKESSYLIYKTDNPGPGESYRFVKQNLKLTAIRINLGIMF
jgi:hypothetical protein